MDGIVSEFTELLLNEKIKDYSLENGIYEKLKTKKNDHEAGEIACGLAAQVRRKYLKEKTGANLSVFDNSPVYNFVKIKDGVVKTQIEGCVGGTYPTGLPSNPVKGYATYRNEDETVVLVDEEVRALMSTYETALIAGLNRGIKILGQGYTNHPDGRVISGISAHVYRDIMTRAGGIECPSIHYATEIEDWIKKNKVVLKKIYESVSRGGHAHFKDITIYRTPDTLHVRTSGTFGEAMGMNSATRGTEMICKRIEKEFPEAEYWTASSNMCTDKKVSEINILEGRGVGVITEVIIPENVLKDMLRRKNGNIVDEIDISCMLDKYNKKKNWEGSGMAGTLSGFNANISNSIAALFIANGDDVAQVSESSAGYTFTNVKENGLSFGCVIPNLEVATIGGGTSNPYAKAGLELMGCIKTDYEGYFNGRNRLKKAAIYAMIATAQEFNTLFSLTAARDLAESHFEKTGRK